MRALTPRNLGLVTVAAGLLWGTVGHVPATAAAGRAHALVVGKAAQQPEAPAPGRQQTGAREATAEQNMSPAAERQGARRLRRDYEREPIRLAVRLRGANERELQEIRQGASGGPGTVESGKEPGPLQVGIARELAAAQRLQLDPDQLDWEAGPGAGLVAAFSVTSPGALAIRLGIRAESIPKGVEFRFFRPDAPDVVHGPFTQSDLLPERSRRRARLEKSPRETAPVDPGEELFWSPVIEGETIAVEVYAPSARQIARLVFAVPMVSHLFYSVLDGSLDRFGLGDAAKCNIEARCMSGASSWTTTLNAVAKIVFVDKGNSFLCTGTLLNDTVSGGFLDYFLTANHCISSDRVARTVNTFWYFERTRCGSVLFTVSQLSGGALLLANGTKSDYSLLILRQQPPRDSRGAISYAGWSAKKIKQRGNILGFHHPVGDLKMYSRGKVSGFSSYRGNVDGSGSHIRVTWKKGTTQGGSSGSGLWLKKASNQQLIGTLHGGFAGCGVDKKKPDWYGRFDTSFDDGWLGRWLAPPDLPTLKPDDKKRGTVGGRQRRQRWDYYQVTSASGGLVIDLESLSGDADLYTQAGYVPSLDAYDCRSERGGRKLDQCTLGSADTWFIGVYSPRNARYELRVGGGECISREIAFGDLLGGDLSSSDCRSSQRPTFADLFSFEGESGVEVTIEMESTAFDTFLYLLDSGGNVVASNDDRPGVIGNSQIVVELPSSGRFTVEATSFDREATGAYTISLSGSGGTCTTRSIAFGETLSGSLEGSDCESSQSAGRSADLFTFAGTSGTEVTIDLQSSDFDTLLHLLGPDSMVVTSDDDGGDGSNSRVVATLPTNGTYTIEATSFQAGATGNYTVSLQGGSSGDADITEFIASVKEGDRTAEVRSGSPPSCDSFSGLDVDTNASILAGGTNQARLSSSTSFDAVFVWVEGLVGGVGGFFELSLASASSSADLLLSFPQEIPADSFDIVYGARGTDGTVRCRRIETTVLEAGTGELQISLTWDVDADVDLQVVEPSGEVIFFLNKESASGGVLDIDSNAGCNIDGRRNENVTWGDNTPPSGEYTVRVDPFDNCGAGPVNYVVRINNGGQTSTFTGTFSAADSATATVATFTFPAGGSSAAAKTTIETAPAATKPTSDSRRGGTDRR